MLNLQVQKRHALHTRCAILIKISKSITGVFCRGVASWETENHEKHGENKDKKEFAPHNEKPLTENRIKMEATKPCENSNGENLTLVLAASYSHPKRNLVPKGEGVNEKCENFCKWRCRVKQSLKGGIKTQLEHRHLLTKSIKLEEPLSESYQRRSTTANT
jgi:hypothetical protein